MKKINPEDFKKDERGPAEIIQAIIETKFSDGGTFSEKIENPFAVFIADRINQVNEELKDAGVNPDRVLDVLKLNYTLRQAMPRLEKDPQSANYNYDLKDILSKSLIIIGDLAKWEDELAKLSRDEVVGKNPLLDKLIGGYKSAVRPNLSDDEIKREARDQVVSQASDDYYYYTNLAKTIRSLEKDFRTLADKLGVKLIEPDGPAESQGGGRGGR